MDPVIVKALISLGTYGPLGIMAALGFGLFLQERKRNVELSGKLGEYVRASFAADAEHTKAMMALSNLYDLGMKSTESTTANTAAMSALKESVERLDDEVRRLGTHDPKRR